jgi:uncharacterized membrane protein YeaQ/YmgE (transglycosylase-associated protein family)
MSVIIYVVLGGLCGWFAAVLLDEDSWRGRPLALLSGSAGALIGGVAYTTLGGGGVTGFNLWSVVVAVLGATAMLATVKAIRG